MEHPLVQECAVVGSSSQGCASNSWVPPRRGQPAHPLSGYRPIARSSHEARTLAVYPQICRTPVGPWVARRGCKLQAVHVCEILSGRLRGTRFRRSTRFVSQYSRSDNQRTGPERFDVFFPLAHLLSDVPRQSALRGAGHLHTTPHAGACCPRARR